MSNENYLNKTQAVQQIKKTTTAGKWVIERKIEDLMRDGKVRIIADPADARRKLLSHEDIQIIIDALTIH